MTDDLALYVHWPFCLAKCPYCDFNSHVRPQVDKSRFGRALRRELKTEAERLGRRQLTSIFFGGGTPSLMDPRTVGAILDDIAHYFDPAPNLEITLEANPTSVEANRLNGFRAAGVNRVSIGIQSLNDQDLAFLGRQHSAADALSALRLARRLFPRVSFDLLYGRPGQTVPAWCSELRSALAIASDHLSLYQLTIEPATPFHALFRQGRINLPDAEAAADLYGATIGECDRAGLLAYEVSNYAQTGAESRHNLAYWRYRDYAGIGPGAHGRVTINRVLHATRRHRAPEAWASRVEAVGHGLVTDEPVSATDRAREALIMGLRLTEGIDLSYFQARTDSTLERAVDVSILDACVAEGYLVRSSSRLAATISGRMRLDALLPRLVN